MSSLAKGYLKGILAIGMLALSGFILAFTFRLRGGTLISPSLVPVFGIKFGLIFIVFQIGYCYYFCKKTAFWWMAGGLAGGFICGYLNSTGVLSIWGPCFYYSLDRAVAIGGACVSAVVLGIGTLKGEL